MQGINRYTKQECYATAVHRAWNTRERARVYVL